MIAQIAPWHRNSFDTFIRERLPELLARRVPLTGYHVEPAGRYACRIGLALTTKAGELLLELPEVPRCDEDGVFEIDGKRYVVLPVAAREELDQAEFRCVGELLLEHVEKQLGEAPSGLAWDEGLARKWLPLNAWVREFIAAQEVTLDETNWLSRVEHLRRIDISNRKELFTAGQIGRACPIMTPEGMRIGRILHVAVGAEIRDGRLVVVDSRPEAALSLTASTIPFLEHSDPNRLLMGANMVRQWLVPDDHEPALVQTGNEPADERFWCGRNLLTAFISWGADTHEDGIVVSASAARKLGYHGALQVGDKLSNRHGTKGTVARIVADEQMPHMPDGTAVEIVFSVSGLHTRLNFGQIREAVMGRIARTEGHPATVPPFAAPSAEDLQRRLGQAGLDPSGMEVLTAGRGGGKLEFPSMVGWVYWGKLNHLAIEKLHATVTPQRANMQGWSEYDALWDIGAFQTIQETFNTRATDRQGAEILAQRLTEGDLEQAGPPAPDFEHLQRGLAAAGIRTELKDEKLHFRFAPAEGKTIRLACPLPHPWAEGGQLDEVGEVPQAEPCQALIEANDRLRRLQEQNAPPGMIDKARQELQRRLGEYMDALVDPETWRKAAGERWQGNHLRANVRVLFSGRTVLSPGGELRIDQLGLAEEIAWTIFGPLVARAAGHKAPDARSAAAAKTLDEIMARSWVILNRAPTIMPTSLLAFHPVRIPERVIRLHPLACMMMNADFDGDQAAVFLPITAAGQKEAGEKLTVTAHLRRDESLIHWLCPSHASLWGLARLSMTGQGREEIARLAGVEVATEGGFVTRGSIEAAMRGLLRREGAEATLAALERLTRRGFEAARLSGASLGPFGSAKPKLPQLPRGEDPEAWNAYSQEIAAAIAEFDDFNDAQFGHAVLYAKCGARGSLGHLVNLVGSRGMLPGPDGRPIVIRNGFVHGLSPLELFACAAIGRKAMGQLAMDLATRAAYRLTERRAAQGYGVLARAMRAARPGVVFARATAAGEIDPLTDLHSRLFVGLGT